MPTTPKTRQLLLFGYPLSDLIEHLPNQQGVTRHAVHLFDRQHAKCLALPGRTIALWRDTWTHAFLVSPAQRQRGHPHSVHALRPQTWRPAKSPGHPSRRGEQRGPRIGGGLLLLAARAAAVLPATGAYTAAAAAAAAAGGAVAVARRAPLAALAGGRAPWRSPGRRDRLGGGERAPACRRDGLVRRAVLLGAGGSCRSLALQTWVLTLLSLAPLHVPSLQGMACSDRPGQQPAACQTRSDTDVETCPSSG